MRTVLVVEHEGEAREALRRSPACNGSRFLFAADSQQARDIVEEEEVDIVVGDIDRACVSRNMSYLVGWAHARRPGLPVMVRVSSEEWLTEDIELGARAFIGRPEDSVAFRAAVEEALPRAGRAPSAAARA
jgi:DNA-binding NtrC family response regulator